MRGNFDREMGPPNGACQEQIQDPPHPVQPAAGPTPTGPRKWNGSIRDGLLVVNRVSDGEGRAHS